LIVERKSDGKRFRVPKMLTLDLTAVEPTLVDAFHFSVSGMEEDRLTEGVAEPVLNGEKVGRYFFAHAASRIVFELKVPYRCFRAIGYLGADKGLVKFIVKANGNDVYSSDPVSAPGHVDIDIDLPDHTKTLELVIDPLGSIGADHSFWLEPVLEN
jgi:hypothetical protein